MGRFEGGHQRPRSRSQAMLARVLLYLYAVSLAFGLLLEKPIPLAIGP
jgi:hypothetical protein